MNDLRVAVRELAAAPLVTAVAILSLALGIGANTAVFSLVNSLLLRPLPVVEPQRLAVVSDTRLPAREPRPRGRIPSGIRSVNALSRSTAPARGGWIG